MWQYHFTGREWELTSKFLCFVCTSTQVKRISTVANLEMQALYQAGAATGNTTRKDRIILFPEQWQKEAVEGEATEPVTSDQILLSLHLHPWSICFLFSWFIFVKTQLPLAKSWWHEQLDFVIEDPQWEMRTSWINTLCASTGYIASEVRAIAARVQPVKLSSPCSEWRLRHRITDGSVFYLLKSADIPADFSAPLPRLGASNEKVFRAPCIQSFETRIE